MYKFMPLDKTCIGGFILLFVLYFDSFSFCLFFFFFFVSVSINVSVWNFSWPCFTERSMCALLQSSESGFIHTHRTEKVYSATNPVGLSLLPWSFVGSSEANTFMLYMALLRNLLCVPHHTLVT